MLHCEVLAQLWLSLKYLVLAFEEIFILKKISIKSHIFLKVLKIELQFEIFTVHVACKRFTSNNIQDFFSFI